MSSTNTQLAQLAVEQAERQIDGRLASDHVEEATFYVGEAYRDLYRQSGGYHPRQLAPSLAEKAAVEYAKAYLLGQTPSAFAPYVRARTEWGKVAAAEYHRQGAGREDIPKDLLNNW